MGLNPTVWTREGPRYRFFPANSQPGDSKTLGDFTVTWTIETRKSHWRDYKTVVLHMKYKNEPVQKFDSYWRLPGDYDKWDLFLKELNKDWRFQNKDRLKAQAKERKQRNEAAAAREGLTVEEYMASKHERRKAEKTAKKAEKVSQNTLNHMKLLAEGIVPLKEELDEVYDRLNSGEDIQITYISRKLNKLRSMTYELKCMLPDKPKEEKKEDSE